MPLYYTTITNPNKMIKLLFAAMLFTLSLTLSAQQTYYKMPNGRIIDLATYEKVKENLSKNGKVDELILSTVKRNDSIIITPKITVLTQKDQHGNYVDPYGEQKKMIGTRFPIEFLKGSDGRNYPKTMLAGQPTLVNFWFTSCLPCIAEIPMLNALKEEAKNQFNFLAITFENSETVRAFLKQHNFSYTQIVAGKSAIDHLKITAYPTNFILDKNGIIIDVYGEITNSQKQVAKILHELL